MPTQQKRIGLIPDAAALAALGYDLDAGATPGTEAVNGACRTAARLVATAARELDAVLSRAEWNATADVMNGTADLYDYGGIHTPALQMVRANLADSPGVGAKWKIDAAGLAAKLAALAPAHGEAILAAVRWFWAHTGGIDGRKDEWWKTGARLRKLRGAE